jgi:hypothetical protein
MNVLSAISGEIQKKEVFMKTHSKTIIVLALLVVFLSDCATYTAYYDISLKEVERPAQAKERYGEQKIMKAEEGGMEKYYFEDEMVKIVWIPTASQISFILTNKTEHSIKIVWDEAAFVDENGVSHRVMHSGVKYIDRTNPQPPSVVVRKGSITDLVIPTDNIYYVSGKYGGWREAPLFPTSAVTIEELRVKAENYIGKTVQVLLPLQIEDVVNEYIFTFEVNNVEVK